MKRCIKWLINWFVQWGGKMEWEAIVTLAIGGVLSITLGIITFISIDKVPATSLDYEPMEKKMSAIQQSLEQLEYNSNNKEEVITVELENDECKLITKYDQNFKVLSTSKEDKSSDCLIAIFRAIFVGVESLVVASFVIGLIIPCLLASLSKGICNLFQTIKAKK